MIVGRLLCRNSRQPPHSAPNDDSFNFGIRVNSNHTHMKLRQFFRFVALWVMPNLVCCHKRRPIPPHVHLKVMNGTVEWHFWSNLRVCDGKTWDAGTAKFGEFSLSLPFTMVFEDGNVLEATESDLRYEGKAVARGFLNYFIDKKGMHENAYIRTFD